MEIFQNIWNALTVENEVLLYFISIPMSFLEITVSTLLFTAILNINSTTKQKLTYILLFSIIAIILNIVIPTPYNNYINLVLCPLLIVLIFKVSLLKAIIGEIIPYMFFVIFSSILTKIFIAICNVHTNILLLVPIYKICFSLLMYLIAFLCYLLIKYLKINISIFDNMETKSRKVLIIDFIIGLIAIALQSYVLLVYSESIPWLLIVSSIIVLVIYFIFTIYSLSRTNKLEITTQNLEEQRLYNKTLSILYDNIRGFKHDFNNIVQSIGGYIVADNIDGLKNYYSELLTDCQMVNNLTILNPEAINNPAIHSLLTSKYCKAEELGIKVNLEAFLDLTTLKVNIYEFTRILGVLFDNAIEASSNSAEKLINIIIRKDPKVNRSLFIIENSYSNKNVDTEKIFEKGYSSKKLSSNANHGLGLWEVRKIVKKSGNLNLYTTKTNSLFKQQLEVYNEKLY